MATALLAAMVAQMVLPTAHLPSATEHPRDPSPGLAGSALPGPPHEVPTGSQHDRATCAICQALHNATGEPPSAPALALALAPVRPLVATARPMAEGRSAEGHLPARAPPA